MGEQSLQNILSTLRGNVSSELGIFQQQVGPLLAEMEASANAHDTDRHLLAAYSKDSALTFIINGEIIRGWEARTVSPRRAHRGVRCDARKSPCRDLLMPVNSAPVDQA